MLFRSEVFQFISIVIKNLIEKRNEMKYRQLRLTNNKIQRYTSHLTIMNYLREIIGFDRITDSLATKTSSTSTSSSSDALTEEPVLRIIDESRLPSPDVLKKELSTIQSILLRLEATVGCVTTTTTTQPRVISNSSSTTSLESQQETTTTITTTGKMTEKQKARILMEEKMLLQKLQEEQARKRTIQQIQNDKFVRQNDPNWKPSVSAAAAKSGDTMSTFRDKFGEN